MSEGAEGQKPSRIEQGSAPEYKRETVQYQNGQLAVRITGDRGAKFDFDMHKWSPTKLMRKGIVSTKSGNDYYIFTRSDHTYIINTRETIKRGKLVAVYKEYPAHLPLIELGKSWKSPGFYATSDVESVLLKYKVTAPEQNMGRKIDDPNPFDTYEDILKRYGRSISD